MSAKIPNGTGHISMEKKTAKNYVTLFRRVAKNASTEAKDISFILRVY